MVGFVAIAKNYADAVLILSHFSCDSNPTAVYNL